MELKIKKMFFGLGAISLVITIVFIALANYQENPKNNYMLNPDIKLKTAIMAGGCFWCVEADYEKLTGIVEAQSGYTGGETENPSYENYAEGGHREAVLLRYDPTRTSFRDLAEHLVFYADPTDGDGSFGDRGEQYAPAIYYADEDERQIAEQLLREIDEAKIFEKPLAIKILPQSPFFPAEEYHQDYSEKNPLKYRFYRSASGRDKFVEKYQEAGLQKGFLQSRDEPLASPANLDFSGYQKPEEAVLRNGLSELEYEVTQENSTERPFQNPYNNNKAEGIYIDRISGEALFSSRDKYDSGTGWPSFTRPIDEGAVVLKTDTKLFRERTEVRSRFADSHLGHVFSDGPAEQGGQRYCLNSASLIFVPKEEMAERGYDQYLEGLDVK